MSMIRITYSRVLCNLSTSGLRYHSFSKPHQPKLFFPLPKYGFHQDKMSVPRHILISCTASFTRLSSTYNAARSRTSFDAAQSVPVHFLSLFPFFLSFSTVVREIRPVSNFDHPNIRWLRRVTPLSNSLACCGRDI